VKERDYVTAQALTRLRVACDILAEVGLFDVPKSHKDQYVKARQALNEVRDTAHGEIPIEEEP
jgi:hypothetical protein